MSDRLFRKIDKEGKPYGPWYAVVYDRANVRHRLSTKVFDRRAAEAVARRLEREAHDESPRNAPRHTVSEAIEYLCTVHGDVSTHYADRAKPLKRLIGHLDVNDLVIDHLHGYIAARRREQKPGKRLDRPCVSDHTIYKELVTLKTALRLAAKRGKFVRSIEAIDPELQAGYVPRQRHLTTDEMPKLAAQLPAHRLLWLVVAVYTGGRRRTEVERLRMEHVDFELDTLRLSGTKTTEADREIPLHPHLWLVLAKLVQTKPTGPVVEPWPNLGRDLRQACKRAGIERVNANDLRRTFGSWLIQAGASNAFVAKLLGHTTTAMVDRVYGKHSLPSLRGAVGLLPAVAVVARPEREKLEAR